MTIKIVTDSTCDLPADLIAQHEITVVPVYINVAEKSYQDGVDITRAEFYEKLPDFETQPTTAAPAIGSFTETYERLTAAGAEQIISIHLADNLSNTYNTARLGAQAAASAPVTLLNTGQITLGSGLLVLTAAEAIANGRSAAEVKQLVEERVRRTYVFGMIDTLDALRRSGRVNWAEFGVGTLLQIKPIMQIHAGEISVVARVRTYKRSRRHLLSLVEELSPFERLGVIHVHAPEAAAELREMASDLFPAGHDPLMMEITPAIGTHLGLGAVGFAGIISG